jgi:Holliday junction resolvase RusA-like endonuclease
MLFLTLPVPPSVNEAYRHDLRTGRRVKTRKARDWESYASHVLSRQVSGRPIRDPVLIIVNIERGEGRREDIDNRIKLLFDLLVHDRVIADDSLVAAFAAAWAAPGTRTARLAILPATALALEFHPATDCGPGGWIIPAAEPAEEAA